MWPPAATLFVLDPRRMKTPNERFKCLGSIIVNLISYVVLFCSVDILTIHQQQEPSEARMMNDGVVWLLGNHNDV